MNKQEAIRELEGMSREHEDRYFRVRNVLELDDAIKIVNQIDELQKVKIPQLVAYWLEIARRQHLSLGQAMEHWEMSEKIEKWFQYANNQETFARAWLDGYEVEQEKKYTVKLVGTNQYLVERYKKQGFVFIDTEDPLLFTKLELEEAGFGGVFDNPMFEVGEVE